MDGIAIDVQKQKLKRSEKTNNQGGKQNMETPTTEIQDPKEFVIPYDDLKLDLPGLEPLSLDLTESLEIPSLI